MNMTPEQQFSSLRASIAEGLERLEMEGGDMRDAGAQLAKASVVVSLVAAGPMETMAGLLQLFEQLAGKFPEHAAAAETRCGYLFAKGIA